MKPLDYFFTPKSVAVVGASNNPAKPGYALLKNLITYGFKGDIFPINPSGGKILGKKTYHSLSHVNKEIDLAIMIIPNQVLESVISEAIQIGVKSTIIISAGFKEEGTAGMLREERLKEIIKSTNRPDRAYRQAGGQAGTRIIGPNCMGVYDVVNHLNATHFQNLPQIKGNISLVSQSGAYGGIIFSTFRERGLGLNKFISIGNQLDIDHTEMLEYLGADTSTEVIALFVESLKDGRNFLETTSRITPAKPIVAIKAGRTTSGKHAALSHTGSMAGEFSAYQTAFKQAGITLAETTEEFFDILAALSLQHRFLPRNRNVGIVTISGGPGVIAADTCEELDIFIPRLTRKTTQKLRHYLPSFGAVANPVDMTPQTLPKNYLPCLEAVCQDANISGLIAININLDFPEFGEALLKVLDKYRLPIVSVLVDNPKIENLIRGRIPVFPTPERAVRAYQGLLTYRETQTRLKMKGVRFKGNSLHLKPLTLNLPYLTEHEAKLVLKEYGIPTTREILCHNQPEDFGELSRTVLKAARKIDYPVALKVASARILHKSDIGGVILNIPNARILRKAVRSLKRFPLLVQEMIEPGQEIIIGGRWDETFGPMILFGLGGIFTEVLKDFSLRICPITQTDAREMTDEIRGAQVLKGYRSKEKVNLKAIIDALLKVSKLLVNNPQIRELDINPAIVGRKGLTVVDARIIGNPSFQPKRVRD